MYIIFGNYISISIYLRKGEEYEKSETDDRFTGCFSGSLQYDRLWWLFGWRSAGKYSVSRFCCKG